MKFLKTILLAVTLFCFISCDEVREYPWNDAWNDKEHTEPEEPETPDVPEEPTEPETPAESDFIKLLHDSV